jgi:hypothetical protein
MRRKVALLFALVVPGCWNSHGTRECELCRAPDPDTITIDAHAVNVKSLVFTGKGCEHAYPGSSLRPDGGYSPVGHFVPNADQYSIGGMTAGRCDVVVELEDGRTLRRTFEYFNDDICCMGLYANGTGWSLDSATEASVDAGALHLDL